jgi:hypothetical protein
LATGSALYFNGTNLGVGTATPQNFSSSANNIVVAGTGQRGITIASTDSNQSNLFFADADTGTGEYAGYLAYFHSSDSLAFATNATEGMRLTSTGLGIGTSSPNKQLSIAASVPTAQFQSTNTAIAYGASFGNLTWYSSDASASSTGVLAQIDAVANRNFDGDQSATGMDMRFLTAPLSSANSPIERMRINYAGNVGIGTSSPPLKLSLLSNVNTNNVSTPVVMLGSDRVDYYASINSVRGSASSYLGLAFSTSFNAAPAEVMRLDPAGNLGLGVTPSSWGSIIKSIEFANSAYIGGQTNSTAAFYAGANAYYNGTSWIYKTSALATNYISSNGAHSWYTAASGTAGNAITFTQAMTLDASGNLGVGTTSPSGRLHIVGGNSYFINTTSSQMYIRESSSGNNNTLILKADSGSASLTADYATTAIPMLFTTGGSERARIDSSGNLLVGATSTYVGGTTNTLQITSAGSSGDPALIAQQLIASTAAYSASPMAGINFYNKYNTAGSYAGMGGIAVAKENATDGNYASYLALFSRANGGAVAERARIDSSGKFVVGNSTATNALNGAFSASNVPLMAAWSSATSGYTDALVLSEFRSYAPNNATARFLYCGDNAAARAVIYSNGGLYNYQANNVNLSDRREKTNFSPAKSYLDVICAIPVQTFNYIDQNLEEDGGLTLGVVAQDVQAVAPELIHESNWGSDKAPKMRLSIYQTDLQYALMKALQELKADFDAYKASHP